MSDLPKEAVSALRFIPLADEHHDHFADHDSANGYDHCLYVPGGIIVEEKMYEGYKKDVEAFLERIDG